MDDSKLLRQAIVAEPENDLLRLVLADWYEDQDEAGYAAFIRSQVELAPRAAWEAEYVRVKWQQPGHLHGGPFRNFLPELHPRVAEWPMRNAFERGLPSRLIVRDLHSFLNIADEFCAEWPLTALSLPTASQPEWERFASASWLANIRSISFYGLTSPILPLRILAERGTATGLRDLVFERAGGPAYAEMLSDLFSSPLGAQLSGLELRVGRDNEGAWIEAIENARGRCFLRHFGLTTMDLPSAAIERLLGSWLFVSLVRFQFSQARAYPGGLERLLDQREFSRLNELLLPGIQADYALLNLFAASGRLPELKRLSLAQNPVEFGPTFRWQTAGYGMPKLRSLDLHETNIDSPCLERLTESSFWPELVELDLRGNELSNSVRTLLTSPEMPHLAALILPENHYSQSMRHSLQDRFGSAVLFL